MPNPQTMPPVRQPSGATTDFPWGPLADCGYGNSAFYHQFFDDFDTQLGATGIYTVSKTSTGTLVHNAADGGTALFTTAATISDNVSLQLPSASFTVGGKKHFYLTRLQLSDVSASAFQVGLVQTTTTPATITNGVVFTKANGSTNIVCQVVVSSVVTGSFTITPAMSGIANNTNFDLAWYLNRNGEIQVFAGAQLVGWIPESGTGSGTGSRGCVGRFTPTSLPTAVLNVTMGLQAGAAAAKTMQADFHLCAKER